MLLYLSYERHKKQWNVRILFFSLFCLIAWALLRAKMEAGVQAATMAPIAHVELPVATSGELQLLTYNIAGLPELISSAKTSRAASIASIGKKVNHFDIVHVQEDFNYNKFLYQDNAHPYRTVNMGSVPFGDGLSTLSKYPIVHFERVAWADCNGADCLTPKGFSFSRVQLAKDVFVDMYNLHATAQNDKNACKARQKNLIQLLNFIQEHSPCNPLLIMGDFNAHYAHGRDNVSDFKEQIGALDAWVVLMNNADYPKVDPSFQAKPILSLTDRCESIDKILFRNSDHLVFTPKSYKVEKTLFSNQQGEDLSDHCAISMAMDWTWVH